MRRYSEVFLIVALFCFLFPFTAIAPTSDSGVLPMTGWDMLWSHSITVSKQPPIILSIPLRMQMLLALIGGAIVGVVTLGRKSNAAVISAVATTVAAISLLTLIGEKPLVQLTDGEKVLQRFENPGVQMLPGFYISAVLMAAAAVAAWMKTRAQSRPHAQSAARGYAAAAGAPGARAAAFRPIARGAASSFCINCGDGLTSVAKFCNRCGAAVPGPVPRALEASVIAPAGAAVVSPSSSDEALLPAPLQVSPPVSAATASAAPAAPPVPTQTQSLPPVPIPVVAAMPPVRPVALPVPPRSGLSAGVKFAIAAASVIVAVAVWLAFHPSVNSSASVSAPTDISIFPAVVRVLPGQTVQLRAMVSGGLNREVQWSIQEGTPGGSVEPAGATVQNGSVFLMATYKAPAAPGTFHVVATSAADQNRKAVVQMIVQYDWLRHF